MWMALRMNRYLNPYRVYLYRPGHNTSIKTQLIIGATDNMGNSMTFCCWRAHIARSPGVTGRRTYVTGASHVNKARFGLQPAKPTYRIFIRSDSFLARLRLDGGPPSKMAAHRRFWVGPRENRICLAAQKEHYSRGSIYWNVVLTVLTHRAVCSPRLLWPIPCCDTFYTQFPSAGFRPRNGSRSIAIDTVKCPLY